MSFDLGYLFIVGLVYLSVLFLVAYAADSGWIPEKFVNHPLIYALSLGVYTTTWSYYGSVGFADKEGFLFLAVYIGPTLAFVAAPYVLAPILRITRDFQLTSFADLIAFRYSSQLAGILVTLFMLAGTLPYLALQIQAVTDSVRVLANSEPPVELGLIFCVTLTGFAILFGARHISPREKHAGLVLAIAFESLVKLAAILCVALFAIFGVFGGTGELNNWLIDNPEALDALYRPVHDAPWMTLIMLSFAAAFLLPRQFHMGFVENMDERGLRTASWAFPAFILLFNLAIPPILWAGQFLQADTTPEFYLLGIAQASGGTLLPTIAYIGGLSAASAMVIVTTLALAAMALNHLLLPARYPNPSVDLYRWLLWGRRIIIALVISAGYGLYLLLENNEGLVQLGLISFVAVAQFLPGVAGVLYWPKATKYGFLSGLIGGGTVWYLLLLSPLLANSGLISSSLNFAALAGENNAYPWAVATFWSLMVNVLLFVGVSLTTRQSHQEIQAAAACLGDNPIFSDQYALVPITALQWNERLSAIIGSPAGEREVERALIDLHLSEDETHPHELMRLRDRLERNLSGMLGPMLARLIMSGGNTEIDAGTRIILSDHMHFVENRLEKSRSRLQGLARQLDGLRRYHRQILQDLPLGACSVSPEREVLHWNLAMTRLSGIDSAQVIGSSIDNLPAPWADLLGTFLDGAEQHVHKKRAIVENRQSWFNLHKAAIAGSPWPAEDGADPWGGAVILVEDLTEVNTLEAELTHSERLASLGRLAAGVAHEIGNPVTGIACISQNLRGETDPKVVAESADEILEQTQRIDQIVKSLVTFSHSGKMMERTFTLFPVADCVTDAVRLVTLSRDHRKITYKAWHPNSLEMQGDRQRLVQVLVNLLSNACDASPQYGQVDVVSSEVGENIEVTVSDTGSGVALDIRERVFEPFFTTKDPGEGTGLGLHLAYTIVQDHGGTLAVADNPGGGTRMTLVLPRLQKKPIIESPEASSAESHTITE